MVETVVYNRVKARKCKNEIYVVKEKVRTQMIKSKSLRGSHKLRANRAGRRKKAKTKTKNRNKRAKRKQETEEKRQKEAKKKTENNCRRFSRSNSDFKRNSTGANLTCSAYSHFEFCRHCFSIEKTTPLFREGAIVPSFLYTIVPSH